MNANTNNTDRAPITIRTLRDLRSINGEFRARKDGVPGDRLVGGTIGTALVMGKTDAWAEQFLTTAKQYVVGQLDSMPIAGSEDWEQFPAEYPNGKLVSELHEAKGVGDDLLLDRAFVPDMKDREKPTHVSPLSELSPLAKLLSEIDLEEKVEAGDGKLPDDGEHIVRVVDTREGTTQDGKDFVIFTLRDQETHRTWGLFLGLEKGSIQGLVDSISVNNGGCYEGLSVHGAFGLFRIGKTQFRVWTYVKPEDGRVLTYTSLEKYAKLLYARGNREAAQLLRTQKQEDNQALRAANDYVAR